MDIINIKFDATYFIIFLTKINIVEIIQRKIININLE